MWPFKRKKGSQESQSHGPQCTLCGSTHTVVITHHGTDQPNFVRTWRGSRYLTCRCMDCGQNFYAEAGGEPADDAMLDDRTVDDEEALRAAEDELKKEADDEGDHRIKGL